MRFVIVLVCLVVTGSALAVPVDPNAPDGIAASLMGGSFWYVLTTSGELWYKSCSVEDPWRLDQKSLPPGVSVSEIAEWKYTWIVTHDGTVWAYSYVNQQGWAIMTPFPGGQPVSETPESIGDIKSMFR